MKDKIVKHKGKTFTIEGLYCEFFEKDISEYEAEIKSYLHELDEVWAFRD